MIIILAYIIHAVALVLAQTALVCDARLSPASHDLCLRGEPPAMPPASRRLRPRMRPSARQQELPLELPAPPQLIPLAEAQRWLGVGPDTFARLLCTGQLPVVHIGRKPRIADTVLLAWLAAQGRLPARGEA
jgi:hypothetical protein